MSDTAVSMRCSSCNNYIDVPIEIDGYKPLPSIPDSCPECGATVTQQMKDEAYDEATLAVINYHVDRAETLEDR